MSALVKIGLLFVGGMTVGLVVPWGIGPSKPARSDEAGERTISVRCIVEYRNGPQAARLHLRRWLPGPEEEPVEQQAPPVEVVVQPAGQKRTSGADEVTVILRIVPCCANQDAGKAPAERPMPGAT